MATAAILSALVSCGVESGDDVATTGPEETSTSTTTTEADGDTTTTADEGGGDETDEPGETTTTSEEGDEPASTTAPGGGNEDAMIRDALIQGFESAGFTTEQATCLADGYIDMGITDPEASGDIDIMGMMDLFSQCGVSMEDLGQIGEEMGA